MACSSRVVLSWVTRSSIFSLSTLTARTSASTEPSRPRSEPARSTLPAGGACTSGAALSRAGGESGASAGAASGALADELFLAGAAATSFSFSGVLSGWAVS